jgi:RNA polymerase sigma factor (sigma-70 family)
MEFLTSAAQCGAEPMSAPQNVLPQRRCPKCDKAKFIDVITPYLDDAFVLARWLTGSRIDAEDVVQDASLRALRGIDSLCNRNARGWLLAIVRNAAYDWLRKNRSGTVIFTNDLEAAQGAEPGEPDATTPETVLMKMQDTRMLESAIGALPTHYRETLVLRELRGLTYREIAGVTGASVGTTMSRLFRARRQLIAELRNSGARDSSSPGPCG